MADKPQLLTHSRIKEFLTCSQKHFYNYETGIDIISADRFAMDFGTCFHSGMESWWIGNGAAPFADVIAHALCGADGFGFDEFDRARLRAVLVGYDAYWQNNDEMETIAVEKEFRLPLINPATGCSSRTFLLGGKIDAIVRDKSGLFWVVEHKTTTMDISTGSIYWERLTLESQISMYIYAAKRLGIDVAGCIYDVAKRPGLKPQKAKAPDEIKYKKDGKPYKNQRLIDETSKEFFARIAQTIIDAPSDFYRRSTIVRLDHEIEAFQRDLWQISQLIISERRADHRIKNTGACLTPYRKMCKYFPLCTGTSDLNDPRWRKKESRNEELSKELTK
jgi:hypothetical protein